MKTTSLVMAFAALVVICAAVGQSQEKKQDAKIVMTNVKYDGLKQEILKHRGKVVVVDFWATWCPNCIKAFPDFIEMQKKYADRGLVVVSVSLDDASDPEIVAAANKFLNKHQSPLRNLLLDEPLELWKTKLGAGSLPIYYLFDRQGKWVAFRAADFAKSGGNIPYDKLNETVVQMLNEK